MGDRSPTLCERRSQPIGVPEKRSRYILLRASTSPPASPVKGSFGQPRGQWVSEMKQLWLDDYGINNAKTLPQCTASAQYGCVCLVGSGECAIIDVVESKSNELYKRRETRVHMPNCRAEKFLQIILSKVPRAKVSYVHIDDGSVCTDDEPCTRTHTLLLKLRDEPSELIK